MDKRPWHDVTADQMRAAGLDSAGYDGAGVTVSRAVADTRQRVAALLDAGALVAEPEPGVFHVEAGGTLLRVVETATTDPACLRMVRDAAAAQEAAADAPIEPITVPDPDPADGIF